MERDVINSICERFLREFMDMLIMARMKNGGVTGYDVISFFHEKFDLLVSPGTVYSVLYSMERGGLVKAQEFDKKRVYKLTPKGEATIDAIRESSEVLESYFARLLKDGSAELQSKPL